MSIHFAPTPAQQTVIDNLKSEIATLTEEVASLRQEQHSVNTHTTAVAARMDALEKRFAAMELRMTHIDHLLGQMQVDIRRLQRGFEELKNSFAVNHRELQDLRTEHGAKLDEANVLLKQLLSLLQPTAVIGSGG